MSSNIKDLFNPPPQRELSEEETRDCVPCQIMASTFALGFGGYLASGKPLQYGDAEKKKGVTIEEFGRLNPRWWVTTVRSFGAGLVLFGIYRGTEGWLWNKTKQYKS